MIQGVFSQHSFRARVVTSYKGENFEIECIVLMILLCRLLIINSTSIMGALSKVTGDHRDWMTPPSS